MGASPLRPLLRARSVQCPTEIKQHWLANGMRGVGAQGPWGKSTQQRVTEADAAVPGEDSRELEGKGIKRTCSERGRGHPRTQ